MRLIRRRPFLVTALAALAVTAGCGVPIETDARILPASELPPALSVPAGTPNPPVPATNGHGFVYVPVFLLSGSNELRQVRAPVRPPVTLQAVLQALEAGPSSQQYLEDFTTAIPTDSDLRVMGPPVHGILPVELDSTYYQLSEQDAIIEIAQVVYTLSRAVGDLKGVQFYRNGAKTGVSAGNGQYIVGPVSRKDYASLAAATG